LIGIVGIVDVNLAVHASIGGLRVWLLFCRGALASLFLSLSIVPLTFLLSRAKRDLWNYCCCETFAAGFLFDDYIHVYVSEGCELNKGEDGVDREREQHKYSLPVVRSVLCERVYCGTV